MDEEIEDVLSASLITFWACYLMTP